MTNDWEKEFDEKFPDVESYCEEHKGYCIGDTSSELKSFIAKVRADAVRETCEEMMVDVKDDRIECGHAGCMDSDSEYLCKLAEMAMIRNGQSKSWRSTLLAKKEEILKNL